MTLDEGVSAICSKKESTHSRAQKPGISTTASTQDARLANEKEALENRICTIAGSHTPISRGDKRVK